MCDSLRPRTGGKELSLRCRDFGINTNRDNRNTSASRTLDLQFAISCALISGLIVIVVTVVVLTCVATRAAVLLRLVYKRGFPLADVKETFFHALLQL